MEQLRHRSPKCFIIELKTLLDVLESDSKFVVLRRVSLSVYSELFIQCFVGLPKIVRPHDNGFSQPHRWRRADPWPHCSLITSDGSLTSQIILYLISYCSQYCVFPWNWPASITTRARSEFNSRRNSRRDRDWVINQIVRWRRRLTHFTPLPVCNIWEDRAQYDSYTLYFCGDSVYHNA